MPQFKMTFGRRLVIERVFEAEDQDAAEAQAYELDAVGLVNLGDGAVVCVRDDEWTWRVEPVADMEDEKGT